MFFVKITHPNLSKKMSKKINRFHVNQVSFYVKNKGKKTESMDVFDVITFHTFIIQSDKFILRKKDLKHSKSFVFYLTKRLLKTPLGMSLCHFWQGCVLRIWK